MKKIIDFLFGWLKVSNRLKHLKVGTIIYFIGIIIQLIEFAIINTMDARINGALIVCGVLNSFLLTFIVACTVEYIQKLYGGIIDKLDIFATILIPIIFTIITIIIAL